MSLAAASLSLSISFHDVFALSSSSAVSMPCFLYYGTHGSESSAREVVVVTLAVRPSAGRRPSMPLLSVGQGDFCQSRLAASSLYLADSSLTLGHVQMTSAELARFLTPFSRCPRRQCRVHTTSLPFVRFRAVQMSYVRCLSLGRRSLPFHGHAAY